MVFIFQLIMKMITHKKSLMWTNRLGFQADFNVMYQIMGETKYNTKYRFIYPSVGIIKTIK